jgi:hypothetical protein
MMFVIFYGMGGMGKNQVQNRKCKNDFFIWKLQNYPFHPFQHTPQIMARLSKNSNDTHCWYMNVAFAWATTEKTNACLTTAETRAHVLQLGSTWVNLGQLNFTQVCNYRFLHYLFTSFSFVYIGKLMFVIFYGMGGMGKNQVQNRKCKNDLFIWKLQFYPFHPFHPHRSLRYEFLYTPMIRIAYATATHVCWFCKCNNKENKCMPYNSRNTPASNATWVNLGQLG